MTFEDAIITLANVLSLGAATGLIFVMVIQPRRTALNGWFTLFLTALGLWSVAAIVLHYPEISPLSETHSFYMAFTGLVVTPLTLYVFVVVLCRPGDRLSQALAIWAGIGSGLLVVLLWAGKVVIYHESGGDDMGFDLKTPGYIALVHVIVYNLLAYLYLRVSDDRQTRPLQLPAILLLLGFSSNLIPDLRPLPIDISLAAVAAVLIGNAVLRWQLFNPLRESNEQLAQVNTELRLAINDLALEKERTERLNEDLREASRYKSEFLANMSHELRTPLNSIVGYSELLLKGIYGDLSDKQEDRIEKIHRNGLNLLALINDILDLSRIEGGRLELNLSTIRLAPMAESLLATIEPLAVDKKLDLQLALEQPLRLIRADELRIRQVLLNLLGNAVKFTPSGFVRLSTRNITVRNGRSQEFPLPVLGWLEDRHWLLISVADSGIGIPPEEQASIFDEFRQVDSASTRQYEGAGLGLAITRKLVELHTGRIWVQSAVGQGSTFYVALPALDTFDEPDESTQPSVPQAEDMPLVLIVEDNDEAANILTTVLRAQGYRVVRASDASGGLARIHETRPHVILVDILMPGLYGWTVIRELKDDPAATGIPIVIASVLDNQPSGFALGASACVTKPVQRDDLVTALARVQRKEDEQPVLVVDDEPAARDLLCEHLRTEGVSVDFCSDGSTVLDWLRAGEQVPGLVFLDLVMPDVNGFEVLQVLRSDPDLRGVPVVLLCPDELTDADHATLNNHIARVIQRGDPAQGSLVANLEAVLQ
jgi:signal transduction histidine kinase/CheY-like chemotaxis protein